MNQIDRVVTWVDLVHKGGCAFAYSVAFHALFPPPLQITVTVNPEKGLLSLPSVLNL